MTANPLHSSLSNEHYSPASIVEPARKVLGRIDLDPASCEFAQELVQAETFFRKQENGLSRSWGFVPHRSGTGPGAFRVFLNPPGGKYDKQGNPIAKGPGRSSAAVWWAKLIAEWEAGRVHSAIFVCFSLNVFRTAQSECDRALYAFPFAVCGDRVCYDRNVNGVRTPGKSPQQDSAIVYVPPMQEWLDQPLGADNGESIERFREAFQHLGAVRV